MESQSDKIPVLYDIVERGENAPEVNQVHQPPAANNRPGPTSSEAQTDQNSKSSDTKPVSNDLENTQERPIIPKSMLDTQSDQEQLVEEVMEKIMPQLEVLARETVKELVLKARRALDPAPPPSQVSSTDRDPGS